MNYLTAGYSHGRYLIGILSGFCYGMPIDKRYIENQIKGRREIRGRSERQNLETDSFEIVSGLYKGKTDANPIGIIIYNRKNDIKEFNYFTPGYGDLYGALKYSHKNTFLIKERASARETAIRVALFSFTKRFLELLDIKIESNVIKCYKEENDKNFNSVIQDFKNQGDSFGGIFEIKIKNLPAGLGDYTDPNKRLQSIISKELFTLGSVKSIEFGYANLEEYKGSEISKKTRVLGGIECGITDGNDILIRCRTRALSSVKKPTKTLNLKTLKKLKVLHNTSDITSVFASAYISKYLVSYIISDEIMKKFGYENFDNIKINLDLWQKKTKKILRNIKI